MGRRLYYVDYWGHAQRDRQAERRQAGSGSGIPGKKVLLVLLALAILMVVAQILLPRVTVVRPDSA